MSACIVGGSAGWGRRTERTTQNSVNMLLIGLFLAKVYSSTYVSMQQ